MIESWFLNYGGCVAELNRMLGFRFVWTEEGYKSPGAETPIGESVRMVIVFHNKGDLAERDVELAKLLMLVKHLKYIEKHDKELLKEFKKKIHETGKHLGTYFGVRIEINIASFLIRNGVQFRKTESPDFSIAGDTVFMECVSTYRPDNRLSIVDKIHNVIVNKSKKSYCNSATILCVDITNIAATRDERDDQLILTKDDLKRLVTQTLENCHSAFGCVLLFTYILNTKGEFHSAHWRVDNHTATSELTKFLNKYYPYTQFNVDAGWIPKTG